MSNFSRMAKIRCNKKSPGNSPLKRVSRPKLSPMKQLSCPEAQGLVFDTRLGQHILKNPKISEVMIEKAALKATDVVLEVFN